MLGGQPARLPAQRLRSHLDHRFAGPVFRDHGRYCFPHGDCHTTEGRAESREIYFPPHESGMAHYSYASPAGKSVLVVEMRNSHAFDLPRVGCCRLMEALRGGRSARRALAPQLHGLRTEGGCIWRTGWRQRLTCGGSKSFLTEYPSRSRSVRPRRRALRWHRTAGHW